MKIGVFDSGVGGLSVAQAIGKALPQHEVIYRDDKEHVPYGIRSPQEILGFVVPVLQQLVDDGCRVIVVACNTVSTTLIEELRQRFAPLPFVALEPMIKPAAEQTKSRIVAVCATPTTLNSPRYLQLKTLYAENVTVLEPDCSDWAFMIEQRQIDEQIIAERINEVLAADADIIVLGCTHYHWIEAEISQLAEGWAKVLQPEQAIIKQLRRVIEALPSRV